MSTPVPVFVHVQKGGIKSVQQPKTKSGQLEENEKGNTDVKENDGLTWEQVNATIERLLEMGYTDRLVTTKQTRSKTLAFPLCCCCSCSFVDFLLCVWMLMQFLSFLFFCLLLLVVVVSLLLLLLFYYYFFAVLRFPVLYINAITTGTPSWTF